MRLIITIFICLSAYSAEAQFWRKKRIVLPAIASVRQSSLDMIPKYALPPLAYKEMISSINRSEYGYSLAEASVMKSLKNSMRYRLVDNMRTEFDQLAQIYAKQNRYSEAKWYLLQSNEISRQKNDLPALVNSLINLAMVKAEIGDFSMALQDLLAARELASSRGFLMKIIEIEKKLQLLETKKLLRRNAQTRTPDISGT
jgi:hypothetical protein